MSPHSWPLQASRSEISWLHAALPAAAGDRWRQVINQPATVRARVTLPSVCNSLAGSRDRSMRRCRLSMRRLECIPLRRSFIARTVQCMAAVDSCCVLRLLFVFHHSAVCSFQKCNSCRSRYARTCTRSFSTTL